MTGIAMQVLATEEPTGWRPIETAPRDGTAVLVYANVAGSPIVRLASWQGKAFWVRRTYENEHYGYALIGTGAPTHWMPCPELPR